MKDIRSKHEKMKIEQITNIVIEFTKKENLKIDGHTILAFISFDVAEIIEFKRIPLLTLGGSNQGFTFCINSTPFEPLQGKQPEPVFKFKSKLLRDEFTLLVAAAAQALQEKGQQNDEQ